jgi:hypothetical protein
MARMTAAANQALGFHRMSNHRNPFLGDEDNSELLVRSNVRAEWDNLMRPMLSKELSNEFKALFFEVMYPTYKRHFD